MDRLAEFDIKLRRLRQLLTRRDLAAIALRSRGNFAWITCGGRSDVNQAQAQGVATVLVTADRAHLVANNIESQRLVEEELRGLPVEPVVFEWHNPDGHDAAVREIVGDAPVGVDIGPGTPVADDVGVLRASLTDAELARYRKQGPVSAATVEAVARQVQAGMTERAIAAMLHYAFNEQGYRVAVCLVGADERIDTRRHPVVTDRNVERRAMLVAVTERHGLYTAVTRLVHIGPIDAELAARQRAVCEVHATAVDATRPGRPMCDALADIFAEYERQGFADEWKHHHQGGPTGYHPRDRIVNPATGTPVTPGQPFAWNPTIRGTKCEDTFIATDTGPVLLCGPSAAWPTIDIERACGAVPCADILRIG